jgi:hypothetical protein
MSFHTTFAEFDRVLVVGGEEAVHRLAENAFAAAKGEVPFNAVRLYPSRVSRSPISFDSVLHIIIDCIQKSCVPPCDDRLITTLSFHFISFHFISFHFISFDLI